MSVGHWRRSVGTNVKGKVRKASATRYSIRGSRGAWAIISALSSVAMTLPKYLVKCVAAWPLPVAQSQATSRGATVVDKKVNNLSGYVGRKWAYWAASVAKGLVCIRKAPRRAHFAGGANIAEHPRHHSFGALCGKELELGPRPDYAISFALKVKVRRHEIMKHWCCVALIYTSSTPPPTNIGEQARNVSLRNRLICR